jgi:WD repeat-containing protein 59
MENQNAFDDEGCMSTSLLDTSRSASYVRYRRAYAELLYLWGFPLARLEVLKFNGLKDYFTELDLPDGRSKAASVISNDSHRTNENSPPNHIVLGKKEFKLPLSDDGLDVTGYCLKHESRLQPVTSEIGGGAIGRCERCQVIQRQLKCTICMEPVDSNFLSCLSCGCITHRSCISIYHGTGNTKCAGGCDCDCDLSASAGIVESWEVMMGAIEKMRQIDTMDEKDVAAFDEWDVKNDWEDIQFPNGGLGRGYSTLTKRISQVSKGEWGMGSAKKRPSSLRNQERA